jgi:hypothetical protein
VRKFGALAFGIEAHRKREDRSGTAEALVIKVESCERQLSVGELSVRESRLGQGKECNSRVQFAEEFNPALVQKKRFFAEFAERPQIERYNQYGHTSLNQFLIFLKATLLEKDLTNRQRLIDDQ